VINKKKKQQCKVGISTDCKSAPAGFVEGPLLAPICNRCQKRPVRISILFYLEGPDYKSAPAGFDFAPLLAPICNRCQKRPVRISSLLFLKGTDCKSAPAKPAALDLAPLEEVKTSDKNPSSD
jgi:hypothetical protein